MYGTIGKVKKNNVVLRLLTRVGRQKITILGQNLQNIGVLVFNHILLNKTYHITNKLYLGNTICIDLLERKQIMSFYD